MRDGAHKSESIPTSVRILDLLEKVSAIWGRGGGCVRSGGRGEDVEPGTIWDRFQRDGRSGAIVVKCEEGGESVRHLALRKGLGHIDGVDGRCCVWRQVWQDVLDVPWVCVQEGDKRNKQSIGLGRVLFFSGAEDWYVKGANG